MNSTLLLLPFFAAFASWLMVKIAIRSFFRPYKPLNILGIKWQGILPASRTSFIEKTAHILSTEILKSDLINNKLTGVETLQKAMPVIETHIDNFLNKKLKEAIPVISMFVGEKIISQLKELFLEELKELFPSIMSQFIGNLSQTGDLEREIVLKLQSVSMAETEIFFLTRFRKQLRKAEVGFAIAGFISGIIQLLLTLMILK
jgi:uncharacterized membrane protein YheB (UPF0754 family)